MASCKDQPPGQARIDAQLPAGPLPYSTPVPEARARGRPRELRLGLFVSDGMARVRGNQPLSEQSSCCVTWRRRRRRIHAGGRLDGCRMRRRPCWSRVGQERSAINESGDTQAASAASSLADLEAQMAKATRWNAHQDWLRSPERTQPAQSQTRPTQSTGALASRTPRERGRGHGRVPLCQHLADPGAHRAGVGGDLPRRALAELVEVCGRRG